MPGPAGLQMALNVIPERRLCIVRIWDGQGTLLLNSVHLDDIQMPPELAPKEIAPRFETVQIGDRTIRRGYFVREGYSVEVGGDLAEIEDTVQDLIPAYFVILPLLLGIIVGGGFWLAGRALHPIQDLAEEAETITARNLDRRAPNRRGG